MIVKRGMRPKKRRTLFKTIAILIALSAGSTLLAPAPVSADPTLPTCGPEADPDGDGYGWLGVWPDGTSCRVVDDAENPPGGESSSADDCVDPDGDGWGWRGEWPDGESCQVTDSPGNTKPRAVVSIGDSYISGEAGRWAGNGDNLDRGIGVYGDTHTDHPKNYCHRSDVAEIHSAAIPGAVPINLACSGAKAENVLSSGRFGETSQLARLEELTDSYDIDLVVISVGGNDAGVAGLAEVCARKSILPGSCKAARYTQFHRTVRNTVASNVDKVVKKVAETVGADTRIVLQSYVSPYGKTMRYAEPDKLSWLDLVTFSWATVLRGTLSEQLVHGCPIQATDRLWFRNEVVHHFGDLYRRIAKAHGIEFLSLADAFEGKELCSEGVTWGKHTTDPARLEWIRRITLDDDRVTESLHPNALGQQALGRCLRLVWEAAGNDFHHCTNQGAGPEAMDLSHDEPSSPEPVTLTVEGAEAKIGGHWTDHEELLWQETLDLSARVTASRNSPSAMVEFDVKLNGETSTRVRLPVDLKAGQSTVVDTSIQTSSLSMTVPEYDRTYPAQVTLAVDAYEGYLFGSKLVEVQGPIVSITVTGP